jgi:type II secretory ATPase GspE/PulE/Tfp pilus assembly ATPase PilB-like protein
MKRLIQSRARTADMLSLAMREGMSTLVQDGIQKVLRGETTYQQVRAVAMK